METPRAVISPMIYTHIRSMRDNPLLPGLKAIYIPDNLNWSIDLPAVILLGLGASLDIVELNNSAISERSFFIPFLTSLASKSPQLSHLALRGTGNVSLEPVYRFTSLQRLQIRLSGIYLYPQTLRRLGNLTNLLDLTLDASMVTPVPSDTRLFTSPPSGNFGMLKRLHIIGIPSSITRVLDDINLTNLTALVIDEAPDNTGSRPETFWKRCFDQISMCRAIEDIEINQLTHRSWGHEYYSLSTSWFMSLLTLQNVKSLVINDSALSGGDTDFRSMARAFPKLKKLIVPPAYYSKGRTLACLYYFSRYCPELQEIKICIHSDILRNLEAIRYLSHPIPVNRRHPLQKLYINSQFGAMKPAHTIQVAEFLHNIFSKLYILESYDSNTTEASNWAAVQQFYVALGSAYNQGMSHHEVDMESDD